MKIPASNMQTKSNVMLHIIKSNGFDLIIKGSLKQAIVLNHCLDGLVFVSHKKKLGDAKSDDWGSHQSFNIKWSLNDVLFPMPERNWAIFLSGKTIQSSPNLLVANKLKKNLEICFGVEHVVDEDRPTRSTKTPTFPGY